MTQHSEFSDSAQFNGLPTVTRCHSRYIYTHWLFLCRVCRSRRAEWRCSETSKQSGTQMCLDLTNMRINLSLISLLSSRHSNPSLVWCLCRAQSEFFRRNLAGTNKDSLIPQKTSFSLTWHLREQRKSTNRNYTLAVSGKKVVFSAAAAAATLIVTV